jgi:hypothetical protein
VTVLGLGGVLWQWRAALAARHVAEARTELAEQRRYVVRMNLVQRYWEDYNGGLLQQGLEEQIPVNQGGIDRRGFEWFYWQRRMSTGHVTLKGHTSGVTRVAFGPDGTRLASGDRGGTVRVWDAETGQETLILKGHTSTVTSVAFCPDGQRLASGDDDGTVRVWDAETGQETLILKGHTSGVTQVAFSPDGKRLASTDSRDGTVKVRDARTGQETRTLKGKISGVISLAFTSDGKRLASADWGGGVKVWDAATGQETRTFTVLRKVNDPPLFQAWRSAPTASGSPPPVRTGR